MVRKTFFTELIERGQFFVDDKGHAVLLGEYMILFPVNIILKLQETLKENFGEERTKEIIMGLGEFQVEAAAKRYIKRLGLEKLDKRKIADLTNRIINILGWGSVIIDKLSFKDKTAHIIAKEGALSLKYKQIYQKNSEKPIDYWLAGILKKHFSVIFETEMEVEEIKCLACGDSYCEFIAKPKS